ncbi:helix-turn-helix domain-containing protein [Streptomyces roseifaciens]
MPATLNTAEAAYALGVTDRTVRRHAQAGRLPSTRDPKGALQFDPSDVIAAKQNGLIKSRAVQLTIEDVSTAIEATRSEPAPLPDFLAPATPGSTGELPEWLLTEEVAAVMRLSARTVREQAALGTIPARRFGGQWRIHRSAVAEPAVR